MPAIEIDAGEGIGVALSTSERKSSVVSGSTRGVTHTQIVLAVRISEVSAAPVELGFDLLLRVFELAPQVRVRKGRQVRMCHTMGPDSNATIGVLPKLVPVHRCQLNRIVAGKLGDAQRSTRPRVPRADEDLDRHAELLKCRENDRGAPKCVIESRVHLPETREHANLPQQKIRLKSKPVLPGRRDGVVAEG